MQKLDAEATSPGVSTNSVELIWSRTSGYQELSRGRCEEGSGNKGTRPRPDPHDAHGGDHTTRSEGRRAAGRGPGRRWEGLKVEAEI